MYSANANGASQAYYYRHSLLRTKCAKFYEHNSMEVSNYHKL
jgi:hypothetical protein